MLSEVQYLMTTLKKKKLKDRRRTIEMKGDTSPWCFIAHCRSLQFSPDHLLVLVQSLLGHILDEGWVLQLQLPGNRQDERGRVQDVYLHPGLSHRDILFIMALWRHLQSERSHFFSPTAIPSLYEWSSSHPPKNIYVCFSPLDNFRLKRFTLVDSFSLDILGCSGNFCRYTVPPSLCIFNNDFSTLPIWAWSA